MMFTFFFSRKIPLTILILVVAMMALLPVSCSINDATITPVPTASPSAVISTSAPSTFTPEPAESPSTGDILLPSPTPKPTHTPDVVAEIISEFTEAQGLDEVTVLWVRVEDWLNLGYSILLTLIVGFLLTRLIYFVLNKIVAKTETKYDDLFIRKIRSQIYVIMITLGFQVGTVRLDLLEALIKFRIIRLYSLIYVIAATVILWHLVDTLVEWYQNEVEPKRSQKQADNLLMLIHRGAKLFLVTTSLITVLSLYNINVAALVAALGVGGLALSLAAQDTLSNVISGIMIMIDQPFRVGDRIEIPKMNTWGDVIDIGLRSTRIRTRDNRMVIVPNNTISTDQVVNYSYPDPQYRIQIEVGVSYGQDIDKVRQVIVDSVRKVEGVLVEKPVDALYVTMGDSAMIFRVRWWIESYRDTRYMFDRVNTTIQKAFEENGIKLAINTLGFINFTQQRDEDDKSLKEG